jgi:VanZ family protein
MIAVSACEHVFVPSIAIWRNAHRSAIKSGMLHKLIAVAAWACLAFIAYATLSPLAARPTVVSSAGLEHFAAFAILSTLFCLAYPRHWNFVFAIVLGSAVLLELAQLLTPDRHGELVDALQKMAGGMFGIFVIGVLRWAKWVRP